MDKLGLASKYRESAAVCEVCNWCALQSRSYHSSELTFAISSRPMHQCRQVYYVPGLIFIKHSRKDYYSDVVLLFNIISLQLNTTFSTFCWSHKACDKQISVDGCKKFRTYVGADTLVTMGAIARPQSKSRSRIDCPHTMQLSPPSYKSFG